ncbi:Metallo-dependent phosphatase-like protein [Dichotomocladium elegans]|nr:Metallo-dependent phosphatase-like protein [Dichotomocladium elegans]
MGNWNHSRHPIQPQQIHLSWLSDGAAARIQFITVDKADHVQLMYWRKGRKNHAVTIEKPEEWVSFSDPGSANRTQHLYNFRTHNDLANSAVYQYKVGSFRSSETTKETFWSDVLEFHTPNRHAEFQFIAAADMGVVNAVSMPILRKLARQHEYDFMAFMGDQAYDLADMGGAKGDEYMNFVEDLYARLPVMTTPGNHEAAYNFSQYKSRFNIVPYKESKSPTPLLYSFNYKSLHLVAFSTEVYFNNDQGELNTALNWLEDDLAKANAQRNERPWIIVMGHRPLYCTPADDKDCGPKADMIRHGVLATNNTARISRGLEDIFVEHNVDLYLCGHRHNYERTYPLVNNTKIADTYLRPPSFFQIISGNSGNYEGPDKFNASLPRADWSATIYQGYGFTTFSVSPDELEISHWESRLDGRIGSRIDHIIVKK